MDKLKTKYHKKCLTKLKIMNTNPYGKYWCNKCNKWILNSEVIEK